MSEPNSTIYKHRCPLPCIYWSLPRTENRSGLLACHSCPSALHTCPWVGIQRQPQPPATSTSCSYTLHCTDTTRRQHTWLPDAARRLNSPCFNGLIYASFQTFYSSLIDSSAGKAASLSSGSIRCSACGKNPSMGSSRTNMGSRSWGMSLGHHFKCETGMRSCLSQMTCRHRH